jgi:hypothetical protein
MEEEAGGRRSSLYSHKVRISVDGSPTSSCTASKSFQNARQIYGLGNASKVMQSTMAGQSHQDMGLRALAEFTGRPLMTVNASAGRSLKKQPAKFEEVLKGLREDYKRIIILLKQLI